MKKLLVALLALVCTLCTMGAFAVIAAEGAVELVPKAVVYDPNWDAYMVDFSGTTNNPGDKSEMKDNAFAMGKITYTRNGDACQVSNIYTMGTSLAAFITTDGNVRVSVPQKGDVLTVQEGCGFLENEKTTKGYTFEYNGSKFVLQEKIEFPPEEDCKELSILNAYHAAAWANPGGQALQIDFGSTTAGLDTYQPAATGTDYIKYVDTFGNELPIVDFISVGSTNMIMRIGTDLDHLIDKIRIGDKVTFQKGLRLNANEILKKDITYVVAELSTGSPVSMPLFKADPTSFEFSEPGGSCAVGTIYRLEWSLGEDGIYATPKFESSDPDIATVDENGLVTFLKNGAVTITGTVMGKYTDSVQIDVIPESTVKSVEDTIYTVWVQKDADLVYPTDWNYSVVYENGAVGPKTKLVAGENLIVDASSFKKDTVGNYKLPANIRLEGKEYTTEVPVTVYEPMSLTIKEVSIVDWFSFGMFVQYPDASMNNGNLTNGDFDFAGVTENIEYSHADGTLVEFGYYFLSGGNFCIMPKFLNDKVNLENFNKAPYYQEGDTLTLKKGLKLYRWTGELAPTEADQNAIKSGTGMVIVETICQEDVTYRFDGNVWGFYKEYTGLEVESDAITMFFGEKKDSGAQRVPSNATSGVLIYDSSDKKIVKVNARGSIEAVGVGTATITVMLDGGAAGKFTKTITVTVNDKITGIRLTPGKISVNSDKDLLSMLTAETVWASGKAGKAVDLSTASIVGFDAKNTKDEQTVTVKVNVDGMELSGTVLVTVKGGGCSGQVSTISGVLGATVMLLVCGIAFIVRKKA